LEVTMNHEVMGPTAAQIRVFRVCLEHEGDECGLAEAGIKYGATAFAWGNVQRTAAALERRGWIDARGEITDAGKAILASGASS
jgi:hypothetical protein